MDEEYVGIIAVFLVIFAIFGLVWFGVQWHHYGFKDALVINFVLGPLTSLTSLLGLIPIVGPFLYWWIEKTYIFGNFFQWFDIDPSWITSFYFWGGLIASISYTISICLRAIVGSGGLQHRYDPYS